MMDLLVQSLQAKWESLVVWLPDLGLALVVLALSWTVAKIVGRAVQLFLKQAQLAPTHLLFFRRLTRWVVTGIGAAIALGVAGFGFVSAGILASGGLTAVVLGFAFREIGENFLAGFFLAFSCPFRLGDLIQSGDLEGVVKGIELRSTQIRTVDGRDIFIPNAQIFNRPLVNFTLDGLRRPSFKVGIDYASDFDEACRILRREVQAIEGILEHPPVQVQLTDLSAAYVEVQVTFWVNTFQTGVNLLEIRSQALRCARKTLREANFTLSNDVTTNLALFSGGPLAMEIQGGS